MINAESYLWLVDAIAKKLSLKLHTMEYDDIYGNGCVGLMTAANNFNPAKNVKFETYATICIRGSIIDAYRKDTSYYFKKKIPGLQFISYDWMKGKEQ